RSVEPERAATAAGAADAFRDIPTPGLNIVAADARGGLAYRTTGWTPARSAVLPPLPEPGWRAASRGTPPLGPDSMPGTDAPARGYLVNANNRPQGGDVPFALGDYYMNYRAARIDALLARSRGLTADSMAAIQRDALSPQWARFAPRM